MSEAEGLLRDVLARRRESAKTDSRSLADDLVQLGENLGNQDRWVEAEPPLREGLALYKDATHDDWHHYYAMSLLGGVLLGQGQYAAAEPLILAGHEGVKARESRINMPEQSRLIEAAVRVVRLYEKWDRLDQATAWKAKLGMPDLPDDTFARP